MKASGLVWALDFRKAVTIRFPSGTLFCSYSSSVTTSMWMACLVQKIFSHKTCPSALPASFTSKSFHTDQLLIWDCHFWRMDNSLLKLFIFWRYFQYQVFACCNGPPSQDVLCFCNRMFCVSCCHRSCSFRTLIVLPMTLSTHSWGTQHSWTVACSPSVRHWKIVLWPCINNQIIDNSLVIHSLPASCVHINLCPCLFPQLFNRIACLLLLTP